jgi:hypothetical protein
LVFPNFLLFFWCEVILNIECLANLLWSLAFETDSRYTHLRAMIMDAKFLSGRKKENSLP